MDRNTIIGLTLIFILLLVWQQMMQPTEEQIQEQQRLQDSIETVQNQQDVQEKIEKDTVAKAAAVEVEDDSLALLRRQAAYTLFPELLPGNWKK